MMKISNPCFDVSPQIVPANSISVIHIRPRYSHCAWQEGDTCQVTLIPLEGLPGETRWPEDRSEDRSQRVRVSQGELHVSWKFGGEQEYLLLLEILDEDGYMENQEEIHLYALEQDLHKLRPYKGDIHLHTHYSDGKESPAYVAARSRQIGLDFMAITDHRQYAPSLEAIQAFAGLPIDLRIYPGEEVHPPENRVHIVNFGGGFSINDLFWEKDYLQEVEDMIEHLPKLPDGIDPYPYASCVWCFNKIREGEGLGIFCHPYWYSQLRYDVPHTLVDLLFEYQPYDALELIGGYHPHEMESNHIQVVRYHELRAEGKHIPIIGASDTHHCDGELFGWYYTIVFAQSADLRDLVSAIKELKSVAVEAPPGEMARAHGTFRLTRYAQFLLRETFPLHDELCIEEGRLMLAHLSGDRMAVETLKELQGRTTRLYDHIYKG